MSRYLDKKDWRHFDLDDFPGVSVHAAPWLHARETAAIASDNYAVEVRPSEIAGFRNPFHVLAIPNAAAHDARRGHADQSLCHQVRSSPGGRGGRVGAGIIGEESRGPRVMIDRPCASSSWTTPRRIDAC